VVGYFTSALADDVLAKQTFETSVKANKVL
jgi:hypothetical protein